MTTYRDGMDQAREDYFLGVVPPAIEAIMQQYPPAYLRGYISSLEWLREHEVVEESSDV